MTQLEKALARLQTATHGFHLGRGRADYAGVWFQANQVKRVSAQVLSQRKERRSQHSPAALRQHT